LVVPTAPFNEQDLLLFGSPSSFCRRIRH
jgi:hypothetical protein